MSDWGPRFDGGRCICHDEPACPSCLAYAVGDYGDAKNVRALKGHAPDCRLAALLEQP